MDGMAVYPWNETVGKVEELKFQPPKSPKGGLSLN